MSIISVEVPDLKDTSDDSMGRLQAAKVHDRFICLFGIDDPIMGLNLTRRYEKALSVLCWIMHSGGLESSDAIRTARKLRHKVKAKLIIFLQDNEEIMDPAWTARARSLFNR